MPRMSMIGVMLLVFIPVLYVDASASAAFRQKHRRIVVGAAGIIVEMALAAIAIIIWIYAAPGLGRACPPAAPPRNLRYALYATPARANRSSR